MTPIIWSIMYGKILTFTCKKKLIIMHTLSVHIVRPANRDWACQTERCHTLSNKTSLQ